MYQLLDLHHCQNNIQINPKQPSAVLDSADFAISAITGDGNLVYCNRAFLQEYKFDHQYAFNTSIRESLPEVWKRFKQPAQRGKDTSFKVINLLANGYSNPLGHLLIIQKMDVIKEKNLDLYSLVSVENHPDFINAYGGLYVADPQADTVKVNPSYEKIAFLSENDLVGRNLAELVEKGFFSKSITLSILDSLKNKGSIQQSFLQTLLCGKDIFVTGKPVFTQQNKLAYILTHVQDLVVLNTIASKCIEQDRRIKGSGPPPWKNPESET